MPASRLRSRLPPALCAGLIVATAVHAQSRRAGSVVALGGATHTARVEIVAVAIETGKYLGAPDVLEFESTDHVNLASRFRDGVAPAIPYGVYRLRAMRSGVHGAAERYVAVDQPRVTLVLGMSLLPIEGSAFAPLDGRVTGSLPSGRLFSKLVDLFGGWSADTTLRADGRFRFGSAPWGEYLLLIVGEGGIVASAVVPEPYFSPPRASLEVPVGQEAVIHRNFPKSP